MVSTAFEEYKGKVVSQSRIGNKLDRKCMCASIIHFYRDGTFCAELSCTP